MLLFELHYCLAEPLDDGACLGRIQTSEAPVTCGEVIISDNLVYLLFYYKSHSVYSLLYMSMKKVEKSILFFCFSFLVPFRFATTTYHHWSSHAIASRLGIIVISRK
jgi:hypothetical protein